jgi:hypothetical protein
MLFRKQAGPFVITVFSDPSPIRAGRADVSVMVQKPGDQNAVLDAVVTLKLKRSAGGTITEIVAPATHARATNKLLYAANMTAPSAGEWELSAVVKQGNATATASSEISVLPQESPRATYWPYVVMVPLAVLLFALNRWLRSKWGIRSPRARP